MKTCDSSKNVRTHIFDANFESSLMMNKLEGAVRASKFEICLGFDEETQL